MLRYGHGAGKEVAKRLASPDTYTAAGAAGGGAAFGTGKKRSSKY